MIRVLVVDDSAFSRQTIKAMLESAHEIEVIGIAVDGIDAMAKTLRLRPDLITLDFEMPGMDGFSFLRWLMTQRPTPVIMVSSYSDKNTVFQALELGAVDFIAKPTKRASSELKNIQKDLLAKVRGIKGLNMDVLNRNLQLLGKEETVKVEKAVCRKVYDVVAVGSSTGGPPALQIILGKLPANFPAAVVISQHMPRGFTKPLAERLNSICKVVVKEAEDDDAVDPGTVYFCPGGFHLTFRRKSGKVRAVLHESVYEDKYIPSADRMMKSAADVYAGNSLGVILTGMGNDGTKGMLEIKSKGGYTIAESEETAVVFGMPGEAIKAGAVEKILPLTAIADEMVRVVNAGAVTG